MSCALFYFTKAPSWSELSHTYYLMVGAGAGPSQCCRKISIVLRSGLINSFDEVNVEVVECPDLKSEPFLLSAEGICGSPRALDIGGVPYLIPSPCMEKIYDLSKAPSWSELSHTNSLMVGAGAGPSHVVGKLAEMIVNLSVDESGNIENQSRICKIDDETGKHVVQKVDNSTDCCHLTNLFVSEGKRGKVIEVRARRRKPNSDDFISSLQKSVKSRYDCQPVCVGGVFVLTSGRALIHVMPRYSDVPLLTDAMVDQWLKYIEMSSPLTSVGYFVSHDPGLGLRMEHVHCFSSEHGDGGHFHYDVTPEEAEYIGYFNVAEYMFRVDQYGSDVKPLVLH